MKKILPVVIIIVLLSFAVAFYLNNYQSIKNNQNEVNTIENDIDNDPNPEPATKPTENLYKYDYSYLTPNVQLNYPSAYSEILCEASGCWDIELNSGENKIQIDLSGQGSSSFEQSLGDWINNWGSTHFAYTYEILKSGESTNGFKYIEYSVNQENEGTYLIAIVDVGEMYGGRAHLAIKVNNVNLKAELEGILNSINPM